MKVELTALRDVTADTECAWRDLAARASEPNPFAEADFVLPAARHLGDTVALLTVREGDALRACTPVHRPRRWRKLPVPVLASWLHRYCFLGTPLLDPEDPASTVDALLHFLRRPGGAVWGLALEWVDEGDVLAAIESGLARTGRRMARLESFARPFLVRAEAPPHLETLGPETAKRLARRRRSLTRDHGEARTVDLDPDRSAIERFLEIEASGWKGKEGTALASRPEDAAFFREMCERFARADRLEIRSLDFVDGGTLAMSCRLTAGDGSFCFKVGYDEEYRKYAPGNQIEVDTMELIDGSPLPRWIDSCADPANDFFGRLFPQRRPITTVVVPAGRLRGRALVTALPIARRWRSRLADRKAEK